MTTITEAYVDEEGYYVLPDSTLPPSFWRERQREEDRKVKLEQNKATVELKRDMAALKREELQLLREANDLARQQNALLVQLLQQATSK